MDQQTIQLFAATRDSLKGRDATIAALIDFAEGNTLSVFADPWVYSALKSRELVEIIWTWDENHLQLKGGAVQFTDYGRAFVAWMRIPKDLPAQLDMFDALDTD